MMLAVLERVPVGDSVGEDAGVTQAADVVDKGRAD